MPRPIYFLTWLLLFSLSLGGCWDQVGLAERAVVVGLGIDLIEGEEPIRLTAQVVKTDVFKAGTNMEAERGAGEAARLLTGQGRSLSEAIHDLFTRSSREIAFSHNRLIVFGRDLAERGIAGVFNEITGNYQFRPNNWLLVAETTAKEVMATKTSLGVIPAYELHRLLSQLKKYDLLPPVDQTELIYQLTGEAKAAVIPLVRVEKTEAGPRLVVDRLTVFKGDRLVAILTPEETAGLLWLKEGKKGGLVVFPGPKKTKVSVQITGGTTRLNPRLAKGRVVMEVFFTGRGYLCTAQEVLGTPHMTEKLARQTEKILAARMEKVIKKAQRLKVDFVGFAPRIHALFPTRWHRLRENWEEELPEIEAHVRGRIILVKYGELRKPAL